MAVSRAMRRLRSVLDMQEEQSRALLESAVADLRRMEEALKASEQRDGEGRRLVTASAGTGEVADRLAGLEQTLAARRHAAALKPRIAETELRVIARRNEFLGKRVERRQAETLIEKTKAGDKIESGRRAQREADGWFLSGRHRGRESRKKS